MSSAARAARIAALTNRSARRRTLAVPIARAHALIYKRSGGRIGRGWFGAPVVVLETVGRRSGELRRTPVLGLRDGDSVIVLAANAGAVAHPQWWLNLRAAGRTQVTDRGRVRTLVPRVAEGAERERLWDRFVAMYPPGAHYESFTDRELPLVVLEPPPMEKE